MESGPRQMYAQQTVAFEARNRMASVKTDSTWDTPPTYTRPDIEGLTALKKQIVNNLPKKCSHCEADLFKECFVELKDGTIMAYCKTKGACGRSLVLFAGVDMIIPQYVKVCPFKELVSSDPQPTPTYAAPTEQSVFADLAALNLQQEEQQQVHVQQHVIFDYHALHGIPKPNSICEHCEKPYSEHDGHSMRNCDSNGWLRSGSTLIELPSDWPRYNPSLHEWTSA